jgi:ParB-like chromosome segregation protein Spo0J
MNKEKTQSHNYERMCNDSVTQTITVNSADLKQHPENKRIYSSPKQLLVLAESIIRLGILQMIIVNEKMEVLCGWRRLQAAISTGSFLTIEVKMVNLQPEDEAAFIVFSNMNRVKSAIEKFRESQVLKSHWEKRQGERTDLRTDLSEEEKKSTRLRVAEAIGVSETEIHQLETIGLKDEKMLELINEELTINDVYISVKTDKPVHAVPAKEIDLTEIHPCPYCGNIPRRIDIDENNNLKYRES